MDNPLHSVGGAGLPTFSEPEPPVWARKEFVWPLSLFIGFAATWVGIQLPIPGLYLLLATAAIAPVYFRLQDRRETDFATYTSLGWLIGMGAAGVGAAVEGEVQRVLAVIPFGRTAARHWIEPWLDVAASFDAPGADATAYALVVGFVLVGLAIAPLGRGLFLLFWTGWGGGIATAVAATYADRASREGLTPLSACGWGWSPFLIVGLAALLAAGAPLAQPAVDPEGRAAQRTKVLVWGPVALAAGMLHLLWNDPWARWAVAKFLG